MRTKKNLSTRIALARELAGSARHCAHLYPYLKSYPQNPLPESESFIYWAKRKFGDLKPVINLVHVLIHRDGNRVSRRVGAGA
jgi:hypothetical protein